MRKIRAHHEERVVAPDEVDRVGDGFGCRFAEEERRRRQVPKPSLQERQFDLQSVLSRVRRVGHHREAGPDQCGDRIGVDRNRAEGSGERFVWRRGNPAESDEVRWTDQHDTPDKPDAAGGGEGLGGNRAGIPVTCMRGNDAPEAGAWRGARRGKQTVDLALQRRALTGVKHPCNSGRSRPILNEYMLS